MASIVGSGSPHGGASWAVLSVGGGVVLVGVVGGLGKWRHSFNLDVGVVRVVCVMGSAGFRICGVVAWVLLVVCVCACGGGGAGSGGSSSGSSVAVAADSGPVVARVGSMVVRRGEVSHWMSAELSSDYYELSAQHTVPVGLVSDPPRYAACVDGLERAAAGSPRKGLVPRGVALLRKCRELYQVFRYDATKLLVGLDWLFAVGQQLGIAASASEVLAFHDKSVAEAFPRQAEFLARRAKRRWSLSDELMAAKQELISNRVLAMLHRRGAAGSAALARAEAVVTGKTSCSPGYVVEHCGGLRGEPAALASGPSGAVLTEQVAALATGRCINLPACGKGKE
jgi:hypothetical protein